MEEENTKTYAYETNPNSEELFKIKKEELKKLKEKAAKDRAVRLANKAQRRAMRDDKIDKIMLKLKIIKDQMVYYNRAGKVEKDGIDILANIIDCINNDVELIEEIERTSPVSQSEIESEAVEESEVSLE
jgi:hypothetical protein